MGNSNENTEEKSNAQVLRDLDQEQRMAGAKVRNSEISPIAYRSSDIYNGHVSPVQYNQSSMSLSYMEMNAPQQADRGFKQQGPPPRNQLRIINEQSPARTDYQPKYYASKEIVC